MTPLLEIEHVSKTFPVRRRFFRRPQDLHAVHDVSFTIQRGEAFGLVGESGSGKSTLARLILRLVDPNSGVIRFDGADIVALDGKKLQSYRRRSQIVFQDTMASLNPRLRVRRILDEPLKTHRIDNRPTRIQELMELVGLDTALLDRFPHQLSGGQRQRIGVARALALEPEFLVADEPVSALDVSVRAQILNLMQSLQSRLGLTVLVIAHDLSVVGQFCDRVAVMYLGSIVELGPADRVMTHPSHPYTQALVAAIPDPDPRVRPTERPLEGEIPNPLDPPSGCLFHTRCPVRIGRVCVDTVPARHETGKGSWAACHLLDARFRTELASHSLRTNRARRED